MTQPREWPNQARESRDRAAEEAVRGMRALRPLVGLEREFTRTETIQRQAIALDALNNIARHLEHAGATTRPD